MDSENFSPENFPLKNEGSGTTDINLLDVLDFRQKHVLKTLPKFVKITIIIAFSGFFLTALIQYLTDTIPQDYYGIIALKQPTLGAVISVLLSFFSILVMWLFVIWSLLFVPYIAIKSYQGAQKSKVPLGTKPFRWFQLYASTFLPMAIFAIAWNSTPTKDSFTVRIENITQVIIILCGALLVSIILLAINKYIPKRLIAVRLALLSTMLYLSLFFTYGWGYGLASYSMLFGILFYLTFAYNKIEELGRGIVTYDFEPAVSEKINTLIEKFQKLHSTENEIKLKELEYSNKEKWHKQNLKAAQIDNNISLSDELLKIHKTKTKFNKLTNETLLGVFHQKHEHLSTMYEVLSKELAQRMREEIPHQIEELKKNAKDYSPKDLYDKMNKIMSQINNGLKGLPESLEDLRKQMLKATEEIEQQTKLLQENPPGNKEGKDEKS